MADATAGAHALGEARVGHAVRADRVAVLELTVEHPRDDLHVAVAVCAEPAGGRDAIVVGHDQQTVARVACVVVLSEAEAVPAVEPTDVGVEARARGPVVNRGGRCHV